MISISVVALLVAIASPVFSAVRITSLSTVSLSNCRQLATAIQVYVQQSNDLYPATDEARSYQIGEGVYVRYSYWYVSSTWPGVIYDILPLDQNINVFVSPGAVMVNRKPPFTAFPPSYYYSSSFAGQPELWRLGTVANRKWQLGASEGQVQFPSAKVLLFDRELGWLRRSVRFEGPDIADETAMSFADGHADLKRPSQATRAIPNPMEEAHVPFERLHNTENGVQGRDY